MTEIYLHFGCAHYRLDVNTAVSLVVIRSDLQATVKNSENEGSFDHGFTYVLIVSRKRTDIKTGALTSSMMPG